MAKYFWDSLAKIICPSLPKHTSCTWRWCRLQDWLIFSTDADSRLNVSPSVPTHRSNTNPPALLTSFIFSSPLTPNKVTNDEPGDPKVLSLLPNSPNGHCLSWLPTQVWSTYQYMHDKFHRKRPDHPGGATLITGTNGSQLRSHLKLCEVLNHTVTLAIVVIQLWLGLEQQWQWCTRQHWIQQWSACPCFRCFLCVCQSLQINQDATTICLRGYDENKSFGRFVDARPIIQHPRSVFFFVLKLLQHGFRVVRDFWSFCVGKWSRSKVGIQISVIPSPQLSRMRDDIKSKCPIQLTLLPEKYHHICVHITRMYPHNYSSLQLR